MATSAVSWQQNGRLARAFHILLVDDDPSALMQMRGWLVSARYRVSCQVGGRGLATLIAESTPDLVVMNVLMAGVSSEDVVALLATYPATCATPIVLRAAMNRKVLQRMIPADNALGIIHADTERTPFLGFMQAFANSTRLRSLLRTPRGRSAQVSFGSPPSSPHDELTP